jgi:hypothetical protein
MRNAEPFKDRTAEYRIAKDGIGLTSKLQLIAYFVLTSISDIRFFILPNIVISGAVPGLWDRRINAEP